ncbi:SusD/RagB family nutrient-binding outer membrane lipoprotein [Chitinophaga sancti]|uniref:Starch-binding associating with outer membrane n=1 Tax=Chitinophaga sancti TaxID=1004 RepID=A0A1K1PUY5_9BACT|nr:SusD/RagB family nutrient-binding outer membrane lipoprotein [Chitinophaga sancti]WQD61596.1 SusD/RagB family nutrient-binding outer membrane lipoprotein [Chitinophaga sancti]WQG92847.1 SusD/RagB family nutrient-binding outer membrane lipoprotein [Chitinophaga sancti]SFW51480.1 Starch-binding associating with outer membrane [Chitinophaga sancti]
MKKLLINASLLVLLVAGFSSCKQRIEDDYQNPEQTTVANPGKLFNGLFLNERIHPSYWDYYTYLFAFTAPYSGLQTILPSSTMYLANTSYSDNRWRDYYNGANGNDYNYNGPGILNNYREMQTAFNTMSDAEQRKNLIYLKLSEVILCDQTSQMVDAFGDIPFSKANSLNLADRSIVFASYDDAAQIYDTLIYKLDQINNYLDTATVVSTESANLKIYDRMYAGDLTMWRRYTNSLRLRLLMRISNVSEAKAKPEIVNMLNNSSKYPVITSNDQDALVWESPTNLKSDLYDVFKDFRWAPKYLIDFMTTNNDPRVEVFFDADGTNGYKGFPYDGTEKDYTNGGYASYDSATFFYNYNLPGVLFTAAEVSFIKAEANERWGLGAAETPYAEGIAQSVKFFYNLNSRIYARSGAPRKWAALIEPSATAVSAYASSANIALSGSTQERLAKIYTQKWESFFVLQTVQAWSEYRRTGYPEIPVYTSTGTQTKPGVRFLYPSNESLYNTANYNAVRAKDTRDTKIFWDLN